MTKEDFDFTGAKEIPKDEIATGGSPKAKKATKKDLEKQIAEQGKVTPAIIAEARKLAGSPGGLVIDKFMQKHRLIGVNVEQLLQAPLKKDGSYA